VITQGNESRNRAWWRWGCASGLQLVLKKPEIPRMKKEERQNLSLLRLVRKI
jgi:hypothetical protein